MANTCNGLNVGFGTRCFLDIEIGKGLTTTTIWRTGRFKYKTGFIVEGYYKKNQVVNYPIQGAATHCLLWTIIRVQKWIKKHKMKSLLVNETHDDVLADVPKKELTDVVAKFKQTVEVDLPKRGCG